MSIKAILLKVNGTKKKILLDKNINVDTLDTNIFKPLFKKLGKGEIERHCSWELDEQIISVFGWKCGKAGYENKTELPPPEDTDIFFGDIICTKSNMKGNLLDLNLKSFNEFYETAFGGFESLGSQDTDDEYYNEEESDESFIVNDDAEIEYENISDTDESEFISYSDEEESNDEKYCDDENKTSENKTNESKTKSNKTNESKTKSNKTNESKTKKVKNTDESKTEGKKNESKIEINESKVKNAK